MVSRSNLTRNFKECIDGALSEESYKRFRNAVELYYKAFVALCDIIIFDSDEDIPDYHKRRDELLSKINGTVNDLRIGLHTLYRRSYYRTDFTHADCREIKNAIKTVIILRKPGKAIEEIAKGI
jgi:hypothetical protein